MRWAASASPRTKKAAGGGCLSVTILILMLWAAIFGEEPSSGVNLEAEVAEGRQEKAKKDAPVPPRQDATTQPRLDPPPTPKPTANPEPKDERGAPPTTEPDPQPEAPEETPEQMAARERAEVARRRLVMGRNYYENDNSKAVEVLEDALAHADDPAFRLEVEDWIRKARCLERLELGDAHLMAGNRDAARREFEFVAKHCPDGRHAAKSEERLRALGPR